MDLSDNEEGGVCVCAPRSCVWVHTYICVCVHIKTHNNGPLIELIHSHLTEINIYLCASFKLA